MQNQKLSFSKDVIQIIYEVSKLVFNIQDNSEAEIKKIFGISCQQLESVISSIVEAIPDQIFSRANLQMLEECKSICAKEFIFFQVQEKWDDPHYKDDLSAFISVFTRDMQRRVTASDNQLDIRQE